MKKLLCSIICIVTVLLCALLSGCSSVSTASEDKIGIIGAMDIEVNSLKEAANITKTTEITGMEFCEGKLDGKNVVIVKCGMGKVNAGVCAQTLIKDFGCTKIINTGVAGSLNDMIDIGDIVVSTDAVQHDFNVTYLGFVKGEIPYTGLYAFRADEAMRAAAVKAVKESAPEINVFEGRICSGDQFISGNEKKSLIISNFHPQCVEMEGCAIAHTCYANNVPFVIIRCMSDTADDSVKETYSEETASRLSSTFLMEVIKEI